MGGPGRQQKIVHCDLLFYHTVDFGAPSFFYVEFMNYSYVQIAYIPTKKYNFIFPPFVGLREQAEACKNGFAFEGVGP